MTKAGRFRNQSMKIAVLCGGISTEREVSLKTSSRVADALRSKGHDVAMIDVFFGTETMPDFCAETDFFAQADALREKTALITDSLKAEYGLMGPHVFEACKAADIVFIGLHGENGEDGKIQKIFEDAGIRYTGSDSASSAIAMSKSQTKELVSGRIKMPKGVVLQKEDVLERFAGQKEAGSLGEWTAAAYGIQAPCVLKPSNGGSSVGVMLVKEQSEFDAALQEVFRFDSVVLAEEYIQGRELTQGVLDGTALPPVEICPDPDTWYDYENKYNGKTVEICPAEIPEDVLEEMSRISVEFGRLVGLSVYYRIDYLLDSSGTLYALEANSLPGMTATSLVPQEAKAVGIDYPELCQKVIEISLKKYEA